MPPNPLLPVPPNPLLPVPILPVPPNPLLPVPPNPPFPVPPEETPMPKTVGVKVEETGVEEGGTEVTRRGLRKMIKEEEED